MLKIVIKIEGDCLRLTRGSLGLTSSYFLASFRSWVVPSHGYHGLFGLIVNKVFH